MSAIADLVVNRLPLKRGGRLLQSEISFSVVAGGLLSVHGPNGVGKTSLLRAVAGFLEVPEGSVSFRLDPQEIVTSAEERIGKIGWFGHHDGVKRQLSLLENLQFFCRYNRCSGAVEEALAVLGLSHLRDLPAQFISHGQRKRLAFARLLIVPRALWLLDEPLTSLDEKGKACVRQQIDEHCRNGGLVVAATHEPIGLSGALLELK